MKSVKDLLEDAKKIATPEAGSTAVLKARRKQRRESISYKLQTSASQKPLPGMYVIATYMLYTQYYNVSKKNHFNFIEL